MTCFKSLGKMASLVAIMTALAGSTAARADTVYSFSGDCVDCKNAKAVLTLTDYSQGDIVTPANFVSFFYTSSVFPHGFTVVETTIFALGPQGLPTSTGYADLAIEWQVSTNVVDYFRTTPDGNWSLTQFESQPPVINPGHGGGSGGGHSMDFGFDYALTLGSSVIAVSSVPLPASAPMFGAALLALSAAGYGMSRKKAAPAA